MGLSEKIKVPFLKSPTNKKLNKFFQENTGNLDDLVRLHKKRKKDDPEPEIKVIKISEDKKLNNKKLNKKSPKRKKTPKKKKHKQDKKSDIIIKNKKSDVIIKNKKKLNHKKSRKGTRRKTKRVSNNIKGRKISLNYQPKHKKVNDLVKKIDKMDTKTMKDELQNYGIEIKSNKNKLIKDMLILSKSGNIRIHKE
tara:strand:+ start:529 stop:1113 length:585 start_codon:yes stop_codon:yes gene_type:complete